MLIAQGAETAIEAGSNLLQYGAIGACLIISIAGIVWLVKILLKAHADGIKTRDIRIKALEEECDKKDTEIKRLNDLRAEVAVTITKLVGVTNDKIGEQTGVIKKMYKRLARIVRKLGDTRSLEDDDD